MGMLKCHVIWLLHLMLECLFGTSDVFKSMSNKYDTKCITSKSYALDFFSFAGHWPRAHLLQHVERCRRIAESF